MERSAERPLLRTLQAYEQQPELALVSVLTMMSRFPTRQSVGMAESILGHLCLIADDERQIRAVRECATELLETWSNYVELAALKQSKNGLH